MFSEQEMAAGAKAAKVDALERILDELLTPAREGFESEAPKAEESSTRALFRRKVLNGDMDDKEIELEVAQAPMGVEIMAPPGMEDMSSQIQNMFSNLGSGKTNKRKFKVKDALKVAQDEEANNHVSYTHMTLPTIRNVLINGVAVVLNKHYTIERHHFE